MDVQRVEIEGFEGIKLVADIRGNPEDPPVLFLHGGGQTRHAWGRTAEAVAQSGWRSVCVDQRGHGDSDWSSRGDYSFTAYCADTLAVVDTLEIPPVLVGASLGGMASMLAEGTSDREVSSGLILVDITPKSNPDGIDRIRVFMQSGLEGFDSLEDAAEVIAAYTPQREKRVNPEGLKKVLRNRDGRWYWHWDPLFIGHGRTEVIPDRLFGLLDVAMSNIDVPTMLVHGRESDVVDEASIEDFLSRVPDAKVVSVAGAAHMIAGDKNDAFSQAVLSFLEEDIRPTLSS